MMPDKNNDQPDVRAPTGGKRLIAGGIFAALILVAIMAILAGKPNPQLGESLPNAPPQGRDAVK
jgi:hypothetical protein